MRYYISDLHFYHGNLNTQMDNRGFADGDQMNAYMISQWNKKVGKNDEVVILGDLSLGKGPATNAIVEQLNGTLYLIEGNHDKFVRDKEFDASRFVWIKPYGEIYDNKRKVILSHYPIFCYNGQYRRDRKGNPKTYMLYGHVHDTFDQRLMEQFQQLTREAVRVQAKEGEPMPIPCNMINCFCMYSDYMPLTLDEWIEKQTHTQGG